MDAGTTAADAREAVTRATGRSTVAAAPLGAGAWSTAWTVTTAGGDQFVLRLGEHLDDFERDAVAAGWSRPGLPVPETIAVGHDHRLGPFSVTRRARGVPLEEAALTPRLLAELLLAIRSVPAPGGGWGGWPDGPDTHATWRSFLLGVLEDRPHRRTHGWRRALAASPHGDASFVAGHALLVELLDALGDDVVPRHLVHADLVNRNVLVDDGRVSAVFDWGASMVADPLYEVALLSLWAPWHPTTLGRLDLPHDLLPLLPDEADRDDRLRVCQLHAVLDHQAYTAWAGMDDDLTALVGLTWQLAAG